MGQAMPQRQILIVGVDEEARHLAGALFEESDLAPVDCDAVDEAIAHLKRHSSRVAALFVDLDDTGARTRDLVDAARRACPGIRIIATGRRGDAGAVRDARFMAKPWLPLDLLIAAETTLSERDGGRRGA